MRVKRLAPPVEVEPKRSGEDAADCVACNTPDDAYVWVDDRWRVRAMDRPTGLPIVLILECRSHLDLGDLPNLLAAELGVMTVRLERAIRSLDGVARVHVNRWGDGSAHLHMWFLARPYGRLQLRGTFLSLWDDILPVIPESQWRENLALIAAWLADFGGTAIAEPPHIQWQAPSSFNESPTAKEEDSPQAVGWRPADLGDVEELGVNARESGRLEDGSASADMMAFENARAGAASMAFEGDDSSVKDDESAFENDDSVFEDDDSRQVTQPLWRPTVPPNPGVIGRQVERFESTDQRDIGNGAPSGSDSTDRHTAAGNGTTGGTGPRATADTAWP